MTEKTNTYHFLCSGSMWFDDIHMLNMLVTLLNVLPISAKVRIVHFLLVVSMGENMEIIALPLKLEMNKCGMDFYQLRSKIKKND